MTRKHPLKRRPSRRCSSLDSGAIAYMSWIARHVCVLCQGSPGRQATRTEVAHVGIRGLSQKSSSYDTIPLCAEHHREGRESHHKLGKKFWEFHGLDRDALISEYRKMYELKTGTPVESDIRDA